LSSRTVYLSTAARAVAPVQHRTLKDCATAIRKGAAIADRLAAGREPITMAGFTIDYLEARHAKTLAPVASRADGPIRLLVAARIGTTRLIDNLGV
ncbi:MAG: pantoate--beta-alanine ligase, partial [Xanthobacteraceae bacterium]